MHEDDQENTGILKNKFPDNSIDVATSFASEDILDSGQITPTATTYNSKREQDLLDEARHEAVARELEWVQRTDPEAKRKSQEYPGSASTPTRKTAADSGLAVLTGITAAAAVHNIPKSKERQGDTFQDASKSPVAVLSDEAGKDVPPNSGSGKHTTLRKQHRDDDEDIMVQESLSEGPPPIPTLMSTEPSNHPAGAQDEILPKSYEKNIIDDGVQKFEDPKSEFSPEHTIVAPKTDLDKSVPNVELSPILSASTGNFAPTLDSRESAPTLGQVDSPSRQHDVSIDHRDETTPIGAATIALSEEGDKFLPKGHPVVESDVGESLASFSSLNSPRVKGRELAENTVSGLVGRDVNTTIEHTSPVKEAISEDTRQAEPDTFERSIGSPNNNAKTDEQAWSSKSKTMVTAPNDDSETSTREKVTDTDPSQQNDLVSSQPENFNEGKALGLIAGIAGAAAIGDAVTARSLNIDSPTEQETGPADEWNSSWTNKKGKKKKKRTDFNWIEQSQGAEDLAIEDSLEKQQLQQALIGSSTESSKRKSVTFLDNPVSGEHYVTTHDRDASADEAESSLVVSDSNPDQVHKEIISSNSEDSDPEQPSVEEMVTDELPERVDSHETGLLTENKIEAETSRLSTRESISSPSDQLKFSDHVVDPLPKHSSDSSDVLLVGQTDPPHDEYSQYTGKKSKKSKGKKKKQEGSIFAIDKEASAVPLESQTAIEKNLQDSQDPMQLDENAGISETADQAYMEVDFPKSNSKKNKRLMKQQRSMAWENEPSFDVIDEPTANLPEKLGSTATDNAYAVGVLSTAKDIQPSQDASFETKTKKQKKKKRQSYSWDPVDEPDTEMGSSSLKDKILPDDSHMKSGSKEFPEDLDAVEDPLPQIVLQTVEKQESLDVNENQITASSDKSDAATPLPTNEDLASGPVPETPAAEESFLERGKKKKKGKKKSSSFSWMDEPELENSARELETGDEVVAGAPETKPLPIETSADTLDDDQGTAVGPAIALDTHASSYNDGLDLLHQKEDRIEEEGHHASIRELPMPVEGAQPELAAHDGLHIVDVEQEPRTAAPTQVLKHDIEQPADESTSQDYLSSTRELSADKTALTSLSQDGDEYHQDANPLGLGQDTYNNISRSNADQASKHTELDATQAEQISMHADTVETQQDSATNEVTSEPVGPELSTTASTIAEDDWGFDSKTSKKDKKKKKKQQSFQASTWIDDEVTADPAILETNVDRDEPIDTPADVSTKEPIFETARLTSAVIDEVADEDYDPANRDIAPAAEDEVWATPTKKSKKNKKGRQTRDWDPDVVDSPAEDSSLTRYSTADTSERRALGEDGYAGDDVNLAYLEDNLQTESRIYHQEEDSKKSRKAAKGKKKGKKVDLSMWEEEPMKTGPIEDRLNPQAVQQEIVDQEELMEKPQHMKTATDPGEDTVDTSTTPQVTTGILSSAAIALPLAITAAEAEKAAPAIDEIEHNQQHINENDEPRVETATSASQMGSLGQRLDAVSGTEADPTTLYDQKTEPQAQPFHENIKPEQAETKLPLADAEDKPIARSEETDLPAIDEKEAEFQQSKSSKKKKKNKKKLFAWEPEAEDTLATSASDSLGLQATSPAIESEEASAIAAGVPDEREAEAITPHSREIVARTDESHIRLSPDEDKDSTHVHAATPWNAGDLSEQADSSRAVSSPSATVLVHQPQDNINVGNLASTGSHDFSARPTVVESNLERTRSRSAEKPEDSATAEDKNTEDDPEWSGSKKTKKGKKNRRSSNWDAENETVSQNAFDGGESNNALDAAAVTSQIEQASSVQEDNHSRNVAYKVGFDNLPETNQGTFPLSATKNHQLITDVDDFSSTKESKASHRQTEPELADNENKAALLTYDDESAWKNEPEQESTEQLVATLNQDPTMADDDLVWSGSKKSKKGKKKRLSTLQQAEFASDQMDTKLAKNLEASDTALPENRSSTETQLAASTIPTVDDYFAKGSENSNLYQEKPLEAVTNAEEGENIKEVTQQPLDDEVKETAEEDDFGGWATTKKSKKDKKGKKKQKYSDEDPAPSREVITEGAGTAQPTGDISLGTAQPTSWGVLKSGQIDDSAHGIRSNLADDEAMLSGRDRGLEEAPSLAKATDYTELSQSTSRDAQIKQSEDIENTLQRSSDDLQHNKDPVLLQATDQQVDSVPQERSNEPPSDEFWEVPTKKKGKKNKQKGMIVAAIEQDTPESKHENSLTNQEASANSEKLDVLDDREDGAGREASRNTEIIPSASMDPSLATAGYSGEAEYARSIVDEPLGFQVQPEQIAHLPPTGAIDDAQDILFNTSDKKSKRKFGSEDTEAQKSATRSQQDSSLTRAAKSASKVGTGIAIFEGMQRAASMSEDQPPKKNRKTSKEAAEPLPAVFDDQDHLYSDHQYDEPSEIHPAFRDSALQMESPIPPSNRESVRDSGFQDANPNTLNVSVEVDPHYDVVVSSPADAHTSVDRIHTEHEIHDHGTQSLSSRGLLPVEESFPITATMQEHSAALSRSSPVARDEINESQGQIAKDAISTSPIPHNKSIFGGQIGYSSDRDLNSLRSPPMTPTGFSTSHQPLTTIAEASPDDVKRTQSPSEVEHKLSRRSGTRRLKSPSPENPRQLGLISTEDLISRLSWPEFDEEGQTINISQGRNKDQKARPVSHIDTNQSQDRRSISGNSIESNESINAIIRSSPATVTPPLRRVDRSLSSDLRLANRRQELSPTLEENNAKLDSTKENKTQVNPEFSGEGLASSSTYDPLKDKGKGRSAMMADVYVSAQFMLRSLIDRY